MFGQRELNDEAVNRRIVIECFDFVEQVLLGDIRFERTLFNLNTDLVTSLHFISHIGL